MTIFSLDTSLGIGGVIFATAYAGERLRSGGKQADADLIISLTNSSVQEYARCIACTITHTQPLS